MEEDLILQQPADRRLGNVNDALPPGPPGAEFDAVEFDSKNAPRTSEKDASATSKSSRRRSPSGSPLPKRKSSPMRSRRSPSPPPVGRRRRSPSPPRRSRYRDYSPPDRRRYDSGRSRRSPDRRRSPPSRDPRMAGGRDRFRGRGGARGRSNSRSRSPSDRRGGGSSRWSPKKKPNSPTTNSVQPTGTQQQSTGGPTQAQYGVMPPQIYGGDAYGSGPGYNQYSVPPPQTGFAPQNDAYVMQQQAAAAPAFNAAYPPPPAWGVNVQDAYGQQTWMQQPVPDPIQMQQIQQAPPPTVAAQVQLAPPPIATAPSMNVLTDAAPGTVEPNPAHDAVAQEAENQRDELKKQRSSYLKKTAVLKKELKMLKEQRRDLNSGGPPPSPTTKGFIDENEKLQNQIEKKLSTIENVIDMLTGIIGEENLEKDLDEATDSDATKNGNGAKQRDATSGGRSKKKRTNTTSSSDTSSASSSSSSTSSSSSSSSENEDDDSSPERLKNKVMESMKSKQKEGVRKDIAPSKAKEEKLVDEKKRFNYVFYDPEMHWCQTCDIFPKTAKDFLNHLHTKEHMDRESIDTPWHVGMVNDQYPTYDNAPVKRTPIRGLTFFVPATAWFCKLCSTWMGDLHCASSHLRSPSHSNRYNIFLEKNPHFEVDWLADRQRILNEKKAVPLPPQITSVSTTAEHGSSKKSKKDDDKSKKRKKKSSDKKDKKKKKKRSKKRKKAATTSSSSSSDSSSSESEQPKKKKSPPIIIKELDNPNPAASIRVAMRKQEGSKLVDEVPPPAPPMAVRVEAPPAPQSHVNMGRIGKWTVAQESAKAAAAGQERIATIEEDSKRDDAMIQQWNTVQPVISESEKKLLEQLKGKLKNKPRDEPAPTASAAGVRNPFDDGGKDNRDRSSMRGNSRRDLDSDRRRRKSPSPPPYGGRGGRSRTRSRSRGRGGVDYRRGRRTRSRSRGRNSPGGSWGGRRRRSRSRSLRRRSRSHDRRRRSSRSRSRSGSRNRIEKAIVRHSEFRPRVPEKEKDKKPVESKEKKEATKKSKSTTAAAAAAAAASGKKLPFIGKMPVFKKQSSGQIEGGDKRPDENALYLSDSNGGAFGLQSSSVQRQLAPTAAQIQMAMMEDVYGNAPPFHPDAGMMVDYDDLMPDPVQFVNLMGQAPPPPPPTSGQASGKAAEVDDDADILPPGIDEMEPEEFVPKPIVDASLADKGALPKDLEDALNIIFPGEKKPGEEEAEAAKKARSSGETQIIVDEPVMQAADLAKDGIHMITIEETSIAGMDEASQLSMNEPLIFNKPSSTQVPPSPISIAPPQLEDTSSQNAADIDLSSIQPPPPELSAPTTTTASTATISSNNDDNATIILENIEVPIIVPAPADIPIPKEDETSAVVYDLDDIPQPPASPTESEKNRRQEELDDLAMLGIDADDATAQCI